MYNLPKYWAYQRVCDLKDYHNIYAYMFTCVPRKE